MPTYDIYAVSRGGAGSTAHEGYAYGDGGNGGTVTIVNNGAIENTAPTGIGIEAVSLGGDSNYYDKGNTSYASGAGNGGSVSVTLT